MKIYRSVKAGEKILETYDKLLARWGVDTEESDILTRFGATHMIACGEKSAPPLLLFHGVGDDSALMWLYNAKALAAHFRLYAIDTLGGPGKSRPGSGYNKEFDDIIWIDDIISALALEQVSIAGVSHGAYLAQAYALSRPQRVKKIACIAGSVPVGEDSPMKTMMKIFMPEAAFPTARNTKKLLEKLAGDNSAVFTDDPLVMEHYGALLRGFSPASMRFHKVTGFSDGEIGMIREKALYLIGEADPFAKLGGKEALIQHRMNARFFKGAGHGINHEIAEEINPVLIAWLVH